MAYSTGKVKSYGDKEPSCILTILSRKHVKQISAYQDSAIGFHNEERNTLKSKSICTQPSIIGAEGRINFSHRL